MLGRVLQSSGKLEGRGLVLTTAGSGTDLDSADSPCAWGAKNSSAREQLKHDIKSREQLCEDGTSCC